MNNPILKVACISVIVGLVCGVVVVFLIYLQQRHQVVDSLVRSNHVVGRFGTVEIPFDQTSQGKVRVNVKGSLIDFVALADEPKKFNKGEQVFVVSMKNNKVTVVSENSLTK